MTELPIEAVFRRFLEHLEARRMPYMIMGGFAVRAIGIPRPTYDADLTVDAPLDDLQDLLHALEEDGFTVPEPHLKGFLDSLAGMNKVKVQRFEGSHIWDVDLFLVTTEYQRAAFSRRTRVRFLGSDRWMIAPEDLVLHKLLAGRRKDLVDIEDVLRLRTALDRAYLERWAERLGLAERLKALEDDMHRDS